MIYGKSLLSLNLTGRPARKTASNQLLTLEIKEK